MNNTYFKLFACCIPVLGAERSIVCDLQRFNFLFIPNILFEILSEYADKKIVDIKSYYENEVDDIIEEYFKFLEDNELGFFTNEPECFPKLENIWKTPSIITNALIDIGLNTNHNFFKINLELDKLNCKAIELRFYTEKSFIDVCDILNQFEDTRLQHILLIVKFSNKLKTNDLENIISEYKKVVSIVVHSTAETIPVAADVEKNDFAITYIKQRINSASHCGLVQTNYFSPNMDTFFESINHNSCLNKKISIDINGDIKNCPSMLESYGNIENSTLEEAINKNGFKKYWDITKDQIDVCKDCEFRHICTDCRAYVENDNIYSKPLKCGYSPYTNEWEDWSTNPLKQKAIAHYRVQELVKKENS